jgi:hypothetical protein
METYDSLVLFVLCADNRPLRHSISAAVIKNIRLTIRTTSYVLSNTRSLMAVGFLLLAFGFCQ